MNSCPLGSRSPDSISLNYEDKLNSCPSHVVLDSLSCGNVVSYAKYIGMLYQLTFMFSVLVVYSDVETHLHLLSPLPRLVMSKGKLLCLIMIKMNLRIQICVLIFNCFNNCLSTMVLWQLMFNLKLSTRLFN